jgi:hypothetical protein
VRSKPSSIHQSATVGKDPTLAGNGRASGRKRHRIWQRLGLGLLILALFGGLGRILLPFVVRNYVNRTLDRNSLYSGKIGKLQIHLWRGAYSIEDVQISKTTGNVPLPFLAAQRVDFAIQWYALLQRKLVGMLMIQQPELNFVDAPNEGEAQTGGGGPWLQMIGDLFPFRINRAVIQNGSIHFRTFESAKPVDVYVSHLNVSIDNLSNVHDETKTLVATVQAAALVMDQAKLELKVVLDPFSYRPTFHLALRLLGLDVTKVNDLALTYGKFDFKRGWFDLVIEADAKEGQITGYIKPLFRDLKVFSLSEDSRDDNVLQFFWQALVGAAVGIFKNQPRDQFGTLIPFTADVSGDKATDILATITNLLRNAFVRAYLPRLESGAEGVAGLHFEPPEWTDSVSAAGTQ